MTSPTAPSATTHLLDLAHPSEAAVLALILRDGRTILDAMAYVQPGDFVQVRHAELFALMLDLHERGKQPNLTAVDGALRLRYGPEAAGDWVAWLASNVLPHGVGDIEQHAREVRDHAYRRRLLAAAHDLERMALSGADADAATLASIAAGRLAEAGQGMVTDEEPVAIEQALHEHWSEIDRTEGLTDEYSGLALGWLDYDRLTDGYQPQTVAILAARPGMGKTSWALNAALHLAKCGQGVYIWLGEQTRREATMRLIAALTGIDSIKLRRGLRPGGMSAAEYATYTATAPVVSAMPIFLDDKKTMTIPEMVMRATKVHRRIPLSLIIVDYVQLLTPHENTRGRNTNEQLTVISRAIKTQLAALAPVLLLSQLSRDVDRRQDKRPVMSDLRDSGSLEQDADTVTFLYRQSYYDELTVDENITEVILAKNRHGQTGMARMVWQPEATRFLTAVRSTYELAR